MRWREHDGARVASIDYLTRWGLVEHWKLDEVSGNALPTLGANTLTDTNTVTSATGKVHLLARQFTAASSESFSIADNATVSMGDVDWWLAAWFYVDAATGLVIAIAGQYESDAGNVNRAYVMTLAADLTSITLWNDPAGDAVDEDTATIAGAITTGAWHFALGYHDSVSNLIGLSLDNSAFTTTASVAGTRNATVPFRIGAYQSVGSPAAFMNGRIGTVSLGKSPPSGIADVATEIRDQLWNGGVGRAYPWS